MSNNTLLKKVKKTCPVTARGVSSQLPEMVLNCPKDFSLQKCIFPEQS